MALEIRTCSSLEELRDGLDGIGHYFGHANELEDVERFSNLLAPERMHTARDNGRIVGGAGAFSFRLSIPGGEIDAAGVTVVGVLPTHRRQGALTRMMRAQLDDCRARGESIAYLWASEPTIYGRFGYGMASLVGLATIPRERVQFARPFEARGTFRLVDLETALETIPSLYDACYAQRPGMFGRTREWWELRRLRDDPNRRRGAGPKNIVLLELDGAPAGYAIYHVKQDWTAGVSSGTVDIAEAMAPTPEATRELWRWLLDFDWTSKFSAMIPVDHPLVFLLAEPQRMQLIVGDALWVRLVDVGPALSARSYEGDGEIVLDVDDAFLPENTGRWRVTAGGAERTNAGADVALGVDALGSTYLGGFTFTELVAGGRAQELTPGAAARADSLFRTNVAPWCPEIF
jgi:predicted acetyltransferase